MDVYCKRCGEPWELDYIQWEVTAEERNHFWAGEDCPACRGQTVEQPFRAQVTAALHDMLGDDLDGLAAELEDAEAMLGERFWE